MFKINYNLSIVLVIIYRIDNCLFPCSFVGNLLAYTLAYISNKSINLLNWLLPQLPLFCESLRLKFPHICCKSNRILRRKIWSSRFYDLFLSPAPNSEPRLCTEYQENILLSQWHHCFRNWAFWMKEGCISLHLSA